MAVKESYAGKINRKLNKKLRVIAVAAGREKADLVLKNATYVNVFSNELCQGDIAVAEGLIVGMGEYSGSVEVDVGGKIVLPGFVDAHIHLESLPGQPHGVCQGGAAPRHDHRHHRPPRDRQRHGHGRHRVYAPGHGGSAGGRALHAALLRPGHAAGRVRREPRLPGHRQFLRPSPGTGPGRDDELCGHDQRRRPGGGEDRGQPGPP